MEHQDKNLKDQNSDNEKSATQGNDATNSRSSESNTEGTMEGYNSSSDKYLAMEQPGVSYTKDNNATVNSDQLEDGTENGSDLWDSDKKNSRNSDAFNQDEFMLNDNIDLDEDQAQSISSEDTDK